MDQVIQLFPFSSLLSPNLVYNYQIPCLRLSIVTIVNAIKVINYLSPLHQLLLLSHLKFLCQMYGPLPFILMMILSTMLFLLIIILSPSKESHMYTMFSLVSRHQWINSSLEKLSLSILITVGNIKLQIHFLTPTVFVISPYHLILHSNGYSERCHRHILKTGLSLLPHASLPLTFWNHAFATIVYLIDCVPTSTSNLLSPYANFFGLSTKLFQTLSFWVSLLSLASTIV